MYLTNIICLIITLNGINAVNRQEVLDRAAFWVKNGVKYSMALNFADPNGYSYRTDCSGYVSMAWHLPESLSTVSLPTVTHKINKEDLKAGDIMCHCGPGTGGDDGHVLIFHKWVDGNRTAYYSYEQHGPDGTPTDYHIVPYPFRNNNPNYLPYRYNDITD